MLTKLGWGNENHAFLQVWASQFQPGGSIEHLRSWSEQMRAASTPELALCLLPVGWNVDIREAASRIRCPTLVLHAERDRVVPIEEGRLLASLIPNSRFVALDSENHMPLAGEPAWTRILEEVRSFFAESPDRKAGLPLEALTARERNILECIAQGLDNGAIATTLGLSEKTVRNNITRVFDKIGVQHRYEAIVRARDAGLGNAR
jgi:DNA-binding NarL/FixJ family response regulator